MAQPSRFMAPQYRQPGSLWNRSRPQATPPQSMRPAPPQQPPAMFGPPPAAKPVSPLQPGASLDAPFMDAQEPVQPANRDRPIDAANNPLMMGLGNLGDTPGKSPAFGSPLGNDDNPLGKLGDNLSFGGAFADGGIAPAGKVSLVGERGPELIMPTGPTKVVPMRPDPRNPALMRPATDFNPVNGRYSEFDGKSRTDYFGGAMQPGKQGRVYDELRTAAVGKPMGPDARSFSHPQGQNFAGPPSPPRSIDAAFSQPTAAPQGSDGRLVASSNGGVKWQQGSGPGFGPPPQSRAPAMRSIDAAFTDNSLSGRASSRDGAVRTGSLSERGATPVGSGGMTPERRMKMLARRAWTRGDDSAVAGLTQASFGMEQRGIDRAFQAGQQGEQRDFMRERDATNHAQGMQMWNLDRSFQLDAEGRRNQAALDAEGRRNQRGDAEWTRSRDAELEDRKNSAIDAPFTKTDPSGNYVAVGMNTKGGDFKPFFMKPVDKPNGGPPNPGDIARHISDNMAKGIIADWDGKSFRYSPIKPDKPGDQGSESTVYDDAGGIIQRTVRTPKGAAAPAAPAVDPKARLNALRAAAGLPAL